MVSSLSLSLFFINSFVFNFLISISNLEASEFGVHDYNRNRRNGFLGKRLQDIYGSVNTLWKDGVAGDLPGLGGGHFSEASSQMDLNDSLPPPTSLGDSASITHVFKSKQQQVRI